MAPQTTILAFGELLWDILPDKRLLGGAPFNFAYRAHELGSPVAFASRIGTDTLGQQALERVHTLGVPDTLIQHDPNRPTGTVNVFVDSRGSPDFTIVPEVAYDFIEAPGALLAAASACSCVCFGTLIQRSPVSRATLRAVLANASHALKVYDINLRKECFSADTVKESLATADILKLNDDEVAQVQRLLGLPGGGVAGFCCLALERWRLRQVVVTLGAAGVFTAVAGGETAYVPGYEVTVADTIGAGDAFTAGLVHSLLAGRPAMEACEFGNALGAVVATTSGATEPVPRERVTGLLESDAPRIRAPEFT